MIAGIALIPLILSALLFLVSQRSGREVGLAVLTVTVIITAVVPSYHLPVIQAVTSIDQGLATALVAGGIVLPALLFSHVQKSTGVITVLSRGIAHVVPSKELQVLLLVLGVGPCLEALCGFGVGAVMIIPLLAELYDDKLKVAVLSLFSQIIVPWGALGVGTNLAAGLGGVPVAMLSTYTALLLLPCTLGFSVLMLLLCGGREALERYWSAALTSGAVLMVVICICGQALGYEIAGLLASLAVVLLLLLWGMYERVRGLEAQNGGMEISALRHVLLLYGALVAGIALTRLQPEVRLWLQTHLVLEDSTINLSIEPLYSPGLWLLLAAVATLPQFSSPSRSLWRSCALAWRQSLPALLALSTFLAVAELMHKSGMIDALGSAAALSGHNYAWVTSLVGGAGGWLTGSFSGGNALCVPMQAEVGSHVGLPLPWIIAAQNASASLASSVSPSRLSLIAAAAGILGKEAALLRKMGPIILWSMTLVTLLLAWVTLAWTLALVALVLLIDLPLLLSSGHGSGPVVLVRSRMSRLSGKNARLAARLLAYGALIAVNLLYASFSVVSMGPISRIDPVVFICLAMFPLAPVGVALLARSKEKLTRSFLLSGVQLGACLGAGILCFTIALARTGITDAAVCSCVNGVVATLVAWLFFKQRMHPYTWAACLFASAGAGCIWWASPLRWQGNITALLGGSLITAYAFLLERLLRKQAVTQAKMMGPVLGALLVTMAAVSAVLALCFGQWKGVVASLPADLSALCYVSIATLLVPVCAALIIQRYVSAVTVSFFAIIEPLAGASFAFWAGERLPVLAYAGAGLVLLGVLLQAISGTIREERVAVDAAMAQPAIP
jgi:lactate permease